MSGAPRWRNLTDHAIVILADDKRVVLPPDGLVARVEISHPVIGYTAVSNVVVPVMSVRQTKLHNLPDYDENVGLIVSQFVARVATDRPDVYCPGPLVRGTDGAIVGTRGLILAATFAANGGLVG